MFLKIISPGSRSDLIWVTIRSLPQPTTVVGDRAERSGFP
jgi:hypothetical protein